MRTIVHVDMDAFFASVEQLEQPEYRGKPLVVGGDPEAKRGVVATCSYEARRYGIRSAMPIAQAVSLCPHAIYIRPDHERYAHYSRLVHDVFRTLSPAVESVSIDEAFLDMTGCEHFYTSREEMGRIIKQRVAAKTGLTSSIGIAHNKFLAKLASDMQKPDGLTILPQEGLQAILDPLPVGRLWGVGPKANDRLAQAGIGTVGALRLRSLTSLEGILGKRAATHLFHLARGIDDRPVVPEEECKSMSREITFDEDIADPGHLEHVLAQLTADVGVRLRRASLWASSISIKVRLPDFVTLTRQKTLEPAARNDDRLFEAACSLLRHLRIRQPVRLLGMGVSGFSHVQQASLFETDLRRDRLSDTLDQINAKYGSRVLRRGREWRPKD